MATKVRAAVKIDVDTMEIREFDRPKIEADAALMRVESAGVGGSDPETFRKPNYAPVIIGHENVGRIEEIGETAAKRWGVKVGDLVALHEYLPCWHCEWCLKGNFGLCMVSDFFNVKDRLSSPRFGTTDCSVPPHLFGGFAEYMYMPWNSVVHKVPDGLSAHLATLAIPFGNGVQWAVMDGGTAPGKTVLVFGPGQQGLGCVMAAREAGALTVILAGLTRDEKRLEIGKTLGADITVDVEQEDLTERVMEATRGRGVDVVVDTTGDPTGVVAKTAVAVAAKGAYLNLNGLKQSIDIGQIKKKYLTVRAPRGHSYAAVELALRMVTSGRYPVESVCSHSFGLDEAARAIHATAGKEGPHAIHVTVDPWL